MPFVKRMTPVAALALAWTTAGLAVPATTAPAPAGSHGESPARLARLVPLRSVPTQAHRTIAVPRLPRGSSRLEPVALPAPIERATDDVLRRVRARPQFPVAGAFNWGQDGARFGAARGGRAHEGQDIFGRTGTPLLAVSKAVVIAAGDDAGRGNYVALYDAAANRTYVYLHLLSPPTVSVGEEVLGGRSVGRLGCSGSCSGDHLHIEFRRGRGLSGTPLDPLPDLRRWARANGARPRLPPGAH